MAQYRSFAPGVEVNGETVYSIIDGMGGFRSQADRILTKHGIDTPQAGRWYPQQAWLDAFKEIAESVGQTTLFNIGLRIPENAQFPPAIDSLGAALPAIDVAYHMNHRGGEIGHYAFERSGPKEVKLICNNPYPCSFDRGIITAFCRRFKPKGSLVAATVRHDDSAGCRDKGGKSCTYIVSW